jgi:hypothetical protein
VVAVELLLQALRLVVESGGSPVDIVRARELAARTNNPVLSSSDFNSSGSGVGPSAGEEGVLIGLFLEDLVAVACSAAGAVVDDQPLPCLQEHGVLLLKVRYINRERESRGQGGHVRSLAKSERAASRKGLSVGPSPLSPPLPFPSDPLPLPCLSLSLGRAPPLRPCARP